METNWTVDETVGKADPYQFDEKYEDYGNIVL
jgi:hypothetical protein